VGIGVTIQQREDGIGQDITAVNSGGPAEEAGIQVGDTIIRIDDVSIAGMSNAEVGERIAGEKNTQVKITVRRGEQELDFSVTRKPIPIPVATATLLEGNIGLIKIENFNDNCAKETIAAIDDLRSQGAKSLIFDLRFNPGGYVSELVEVLDYLLPECVVFRETDYRGVESAEYSDAACVDMPIAVLVNAHSYSAAEFFPACLREYDKAIVVGEQTCGKGYYQRVIQLSDGSVVNLSIGKYFTPKGVSLAETGGLTPDISVAVDDETLAKIYYGAITPEEDPQLQAAIGALTGKNG
jgi:carboxyl-terminal processing protease